MSERDHRDGRPEAPEGTAPKPPAPGEPEGDWAVEIPRLRRTQGDRLRRVFEAFDDEQEER